MKNKKIKGLACVLTCALLLPACKKPVADVPVGLSDVAVWGMPGTEKVYEDIEQGSAYYAKYKTSPAINLKMAKGEYEGGQIIVSASKDATFDFISADLVCGDNKISKENVEILNCNPNSSSIIYSLPYKTSVFSLFTTSANPS